MRGYLAGIGLAAAVGLLAIGPQGRAEEKPTALLEIRPETTERSTRLLLEATGPLSYTYYSPDPLTLVLDIPEVDGTKVPAKINVASPEVESVRVTGMSRADGRTLTRVEVRLASLSPYHVFTRDNRLVVEFDRAAQRGDSEPASAPPPAEVATPAPAPPTPAVVPPAPVVASAPQPPSPAPVRNTRRNATTVTAVTHAEEGVQLAVTITADGSLSYEDFFLANPDRLVVDLNGVSVTRRNLVVEKDPVRKVRIAQFSTGTPRVARLVLDLARKTPYRIVEASDGVKILFDRGGMDRGGTVVAEPLAAMRPPVDARPAVAAAVSAVAAPPPTVVEEPAMAPVEPIVIAPALAAVPALPAEPEGGSGFEARGLGPDEKKYTGHPISMDFKDGDLLDIFRLFADISGLNVIINPGVQGKVTLKLTEVPWDQALDLILKTQGLGYQRDDTVIRIAKLADLQREESDRRKLQEEAELAGELSEVLKRVSYAKAGDLADVVKRSGAISRRGTIHVDARTNTIIIKDLPPFLDRSKSLIAELDQPTRQVEIEARVVVTKRNFSRDIGVQWGFLNQKTPAYGATTSLAFPNSVTVGGRRTGEDPGAIDAGIGTYMVNLPAAGASSGVGVTMGSITGGLTLDAALTALEKQGRGRILSTPKITTQDNKEAEIKQGYQLPILVEQNNTVTLVYKDATLTLRVTPQITEAGTVILSLKLENNKPDFSVTVRGAPAIAVQEASTVLLVNDGDTAVVGGVYSTSETTGMTNTPFFAKIPLLGYLFQERNRTQENQELMLFITPHITKS